MDTPDPISLDTPACSRCQKPAVMKQLSSGNIYCKTCFISMFDQRVRQTINRFKMLQAFDKIAIGVSGGKDSTALLFSIKKIEKRFPNAELLPIYIDEGIQHYNEYSLPIIQDHVKQLDLPLHTFSYKDLYNATLDEVILEATETVKKRLPACSYCGILRRRALAEAAKAVGATKIMTGHNLDDTAQTLLMNILRGDVQRITNAFGSTNQGSNPFPPRIKPFLFTPERDIVLYNFYQGFTYQLVECPYRNEALRSDVREFLNTLETKNPNVKQTLTKFSANLAVTLSENLEFTSNHICNNCGTPSTQQTCKTAKSSNPCQSLFPLPTFQLLK
ncbi:TIGR00269 family protein [bacterium]|nr:TIGR00269 family protein [bacterium]